jgi:processive 1,2-diacylglycerol beta-glucosyltransferase
VRVLIFSASIGEGHDLPARVLADDLAELDPAGELEIVDSLAAVGWPVGPIVLNSSPFFSDWGNRVFEVEYWLVTRSRAARAVGGAVASGFTRRRILALLDARRPDVIVSTYPGITELLGRWRSQGRVRAPVASAITDLAALRFWAHPAVDVHLVTHPESAQEVRSIAPATRIVPVRGLNSPAFLVPRDRLDARRALGLPEAGSLVVVSGGGWAVGDLTGAVEAALGLADTFVVALCGRNETVHADLEGRFGADPRVHVWGFTERMSDLLAAADALVHSTAGLTVLEAHVRGCPIVSYGWGRGHIRANNRAFVRFGLADVAHDRGQLRAALARALRERNAPDLSFARLPTAASVVLEAGSPGSRPAGP